MTWLTIDRQSGCTELDSLLALHPETGDALRRLVAAARESVDASVFVPCVFRAAQLLGVDRAVVEECVLNGSSFDVSAVTTRHSLAIAYTEQFVLDHTQIGDDEIARMLSEFSTGEFFRLQVAIGVIERVLRLCRIFEIAPTKGSAA